MEKKIPATEARQGRLGIQILMVLVFALVLAGAVWLGLEFYGESIDQGSAGQPSAVDQVAPAATQPQTSQ